MQSYATMVLLMLLLASRAPAAQDLARELLVREVANDTALLEKDAENPRLLNSIGFALFKLERLEEARDMLGRAVQADPGLAIAHNNLGAVRLHLKEYSRAEASFRRALQIDRQYVKAAYNLAVALFRQKRYLDAYDAYRDAKRIDRQYVEQRFDGSGAREQVKAAMRENPDDEAWAALMNRSMQSGE